MGRPTPTLPLASKQVRAMAPFPLASHPSNRYGGCSNEQAEACWVRTREETGNRVGPATGSGGARAPSPTGKAKKAHQRGAPPSSESWRWAGPERKGGERRGERVGVWVMRGATTPTANRRTGRAGLGSRGVVVGAGQRRLGRRPRGDGRAPRRFSWSARPAARARPTANGEFACRRGPPASAPMRANRRERRRGGCAGLGSRGGHWGIAKTHSQCRDLNRARARGAAAPRRVRPLPPSGGCWRPRAAVGGWPIWGRR
jgi:hypothetical protein